MIKIRSLVWDEWNRNHIAKHKVSKQESEDEGGDLSMKPKKIPEFASLADEAEFWDTHDVTDYLSEMKFVDLEFLSKQKKEGNITIRIEAKLKERLEKLAQGYGINLSSLARMWLIEKLRQTQTK